MASAFLVSLATVQRFAATARSMARFRPLSWRRSAVPMTPTPFGVPSSCDASNDSLGEVAVTPSKPYTLVGQTLPTEVGNGGGLRASWSAAMEVGPELGQVSA